jgi:hypothetical protein
MRIRIIVVLRGSGGVLHAGAIRYAAALIHEKEYPKPGVTLEHPFVTDQTGAHRKG